jgi:type IV secretion system protein TrbL
VLAMRATLFLLLFGLAPLAHAAGMMDTLVSQVQSASGGWMSTALGYATNLFFGLAALEFAWSSIQLTLKKSELSEIMVGTLFKVMSLSFFAMVLIKAPEWIPAIINSFKVAGAGVGGSSVLSPSAVFDQGLQVAASLMQFSNDAAPSTGSMIINTLTNSGQGLGKFMLSAIIVGVASVFIILGYGLIAVQLLITLVESYLIIGGGALMLGFSGSRWTHNLSEKYFGYAISVGVKLFTIYLIIGFGDSFTQALKDTIAAAYAAHPEGPSFGDYLGVGGASLFYGVTGYMAPGLAGSMLNGTVAMSLQSAGTAAGMVGGTPVAAALASSAAGTRALGLAGGAIGALLPVQRAAGAIGGIIGGRWLRRWHQWFGQARLTQSVPSTQSVLAILFRLLLHQASPGVRAVPALPAVQIAKALLGRLQWCLRVHLTYPLQRARPARLTGLVRLMQSLVLLARHPARLNVKGRDPA